MRTARPFKPTQDKAPVSGCERKARRPVGESPLRGSGHRRDPPDKERIKSAGSRKRKSRNFLVSLVTNKNGVKNGVTTRDSGLR